MECVLLASDIAFEVRAICREVGEDSLVDKYLLGLQTSERKKLVRAIKRLAEYGVPRNKQKCRKLDKNLFELKEGHCRVLFFYGGPGIIVVTHGFTKKTKKTPPQEKGKAIEFRRQYMDAVSHGLISGNRETE